MNAEKPTPLLSNASTVTLIGHDTSKQLEIPTSNLVVTNYTESLDPLEWLDHVRIAKHSNSSFPMSGNDAMDIQDDGVVGYPGDDNVMMIRRYLLYFF